MIDGSRSERVCQLVLVIVASKEGVSDNSPGSEVSVKEDC